jgi:hypothetical protein
MSSTSNTINYLHHQEVLEDHLQQQELFNVLSVIESSTLLQLLVVTKMLKNLKELMQELEPLTTITMVPFIINITMFQQTLFLWFLSIVLLHTLPLILINMFSTTMLLLLLLLQLMINMLMLLTMSILTSHFTCEKKVFIFLGFVLNNFYVKKQKHYPLLLWFR